MPKVQLGKLLGDFKIVQALLVSLSCFVFYLNLQKIVQSPTGWAFVYLYSVKQLSIQPGSSCKLFLLIEVMLMNMFVQVL